MRRAAVGVTIALLLTGSGAAAQVSSSVPKLKLIGRAQMQFSTTSVDEAELRAAGVTPAATLPASMFETRRVRFGAELDYTDLVTGKVELELAMARLLLRDVWMNLAIDPVLQLRIGQFKKPFSLMQLTSSTRWPIIERGERIRGLAESLTLADTGHVLTSFRGNVLLGEEQQLLDFMGYQNFDLGAAVHGTSGPFGYQIGVFNGTGSDTRDDNNGKSVAGRVTLKPWKERFLTVGAGASRREFRQATTPTIQSRSGTALEADVEWGDFRRAGLHLLGEVTGGRNLATVEEDFFAAQAVLALYRPVSGRRYEGWEVAGRLSYGDPQRGVDGDEALLLTPGINLYFSGRNRLMLNWDFFLPSGDAFSSENALRAQAQVYF